MDERSEKSPVQKNTKGIRNIGIMLLAAATLVCFVLAFFIPGMQIVAVALALQPLLAPLVIAIMGIIAELLWMGGCAFFAWLSERNYFQFFDFSSVNSLISDSSPSSPSVQSTSYSLESSFKFPVFHQVEDQPAPYISEKLVKCKQLLLQIFLPSEQSVKQQWRTPEKEKIVKQISMQPIKINNQDCLELYTATVSSKDFKRSEGDKLSGLLRKHSEEYLLLDLLQRLVDRFLLCYEDTPDSYLKLAIEENLKDQTVNIILYTTEQLLGQLLKFSEQKPKTQEVQAFLQTATDGFFEIKAIGSDRGSYNGGDLYLYFESKYPVAATRVAEKINKLLNKTVVAKTSSYHSSLSIFSEDFDAILEAAASHKNENQPKNS